MVSTVDKIDDVHNLCAWAHDWLMLFNVEKCKVMHLVFRNSNADYFLGTEKLQPFVRKKDFRVIVSEEFKVSKQCFKVVNTANRNLGMIKTSSVYESTNNLAVIQVPCLTTPGIPCTGMEASFTERYKVFLE